MNSIDKINYKDCYSCRSCELSCPKNCISLIENTEGFFYPKINHDVCIECGICLSKCPSANMYTNENFEKQYFGLKSKNKKLLQKSASGGVFAEIANYILNNQGFVCGAAYDEKLYVKHIICNTPDELTKIQGSKYVFCDTAKIYKKIEELLKSNKTVLFGGSPCQVAGLKKYLNREYERLYTIDIICHGTPSQKLFRKYLEWLNQKLGEVVIEYSFRDKLVDGWSCGGKTKTKTKTKTIHGKLDPYYSSFLAGKTYKYACYNCQYANIKHRPGDLTIGDYWGVSYFHPDFYSSEGVSCCSINNNRGQKLFDLIRNCFDIVELNQEQITYKNGNLLNPTKEPMERCLIYEGIDELPLNQYMKKLLPPRNVLVKSYLKILVPRRLINIVKTIIGKIKR